MILRQLSPDTDRALVAALYAEAADYVAIERDAEPGPELTDEYFADAPPGIDPATSFRLGALDGEGSLLGLIEQSFGYPTDEDSYLGLMLLAPRARGRGLGRILLEEAEAEARRRGKRRLYLAVLDANPRGRAFWEREGFILHEGGRSVTLGEKTQTASRMVKDL
ncbi:GNAT family N-acetyltransferase [Tabrizicola sp. J26]|uniref:GNAT family N-acetyltransferase n=1 Tax=Alitabrizicola rongguiensis TaxID=2909234 RepID=UPI001F32D93C|nr:GNAT family N-acetyltransferase [Tabrizicola rongguiensis]MCF1710482.1 GNAT family N-acetyltransferase [Tabrizicola rongguiensis]